MIQNKHHFVLGSFVLTGIALIGTSVTILGAQALWEDYLLMETYIVEPVNGLERGSPVKFRGITVGKVEEITVVSKIYETKQSYAYVRVKVFLTSLPIPPGATPGDTVEDRVLQGLRVSLASTGITGGSYLETDYRDPTKTPRLEIDWTPTNIYVPSVPSTLSRLEVSLVDVLENLARTDIEGVVAAARDTMRSLEKSMKDLDLQGLSKNAQDLLAKAGTTVESAGEDFDTLSAEINETLMTLRGTFGTTFKTADETLAAVNALIEKGQLEKSLAHFARVLDEADAVIRDIRTLTGRTDRTVAGMNQLVRGRSRDFALAISNLREILENVSALTSTLEQYPSLLFVGNAPKGAGKKAEGVNK